MEHKGTCPIETDRLWLRRFSMDDTEAAFYNWESDEKVTKYLCWTAMRSIAETKVVMQEWVDGYADLSFYQWAIVPKDLNEPIGTISVVGMDELTGKMQIGYCIGSKWWRKGYTSEAFLGILPFLFDEVKALRIEAQHDPDNPGSGKVMQRCGLRYEGTLRKADRNNTGIVDACLYGLLAEDYHRRTQPPKDRIELQFNQMEEAILIMREVAAWGRSMGYRVWKDEWLRKEALLTEDVLPENFCVGKSNGESACAFLLMYSDPEYWKKDTQIKAAYLHKFCVRRKFAHQNMTQRVLDAVKEFCKSKGIRVLRLDTGLDEKAVRKIYLNAGFRIVDILDHENGRSTALYECQI